MQLVPQPAIEIGGTIFANYTHLSVNGVMVEVARIAALAQGGAAGASAPEANPLPDVAEAADRMNESFPIEPRKYGPGSGERSRGGTPSNEG